MKQGHKAVLKLLKDEFPKIAVEMIVNTRGGHKKLYLSTPTGKHFFVAPGSPSDTRAMLNNRALFRRWIKDDTQTKTQTQTTTEEPKCLTD